MPYLWSQPFRKSTPPPASLINIFVACLSDDERDELVQAGIRIPAIFKRPPTFNYAFFIPHVSLERFYSAVHQWTLQTSAKRRSVVNYRCNTEINDMSLVVYCALCRLLFGNRSNIHSLSLDRPSRNTTPLMDKSLGIDLQVRNIKDLSIRYTTDSFLFEALHKHAVNIENLTVIKSSDSGLRNFDDQQYLSSLIFSQHKLRRFSLTCYDSVDGFTSNVLIPLASQADTLVSLKLHGIPFPSDCSITALTSCTSLEELEIRRCPNGPGCSLAAIQAIELPNLRKIRVIESSILWGTFMATVISKNPTDLEEVFYQPWEDEEHNVMSTSIIQSIAQWRPKLQKLGVALSVDEVPFLEEILTGCKIEHLSLFSMGNPEGEMEKIWPELGHHMPTTLKHLNVWIFIGAKSMDQFLQNTKATLDSLYVDAWVEDFLCHPYSDVLTRHLKDRPMDL
ncbi:19461_t:CDS:2, partial [Funneliformis geosporum]